MPPQCYLAVSAKEHLDTAKLLQPCDHSSDAKLPSDASPWRSLQMYFPAAEGPVGWTLLHPLE